MLASLALAAGVAFGAPEDGLRFDPPPLEHGWDLREDWDDTWRRFQDRHGRPDLEGPLLQPAPELQHPEYELTLAVARHPLYLERDWNRRTRGARLFIHSDDEFSFFNTVRLKERIPMGKVGALGLRYDRIELRGIHSSMFRLNFAFPDIRGSGVFVEIRPIARFEKQDLDAELAVGWARPGLARLTARVFFFDPASPASDGLANSRGQTQELRVIQRAPSIGAAAEAELFLHRNLRAELFFGGVAPSRSTLYYEDPEAVDYDRTQTAMLGGAWLEWILPRAPLRLGAAMQAVGTRQINQNFDRAILDIIPERELRGRVYALARISEATLGRPFLGELSIEGAAIYRRTDLPRHSSEHGSVTDDRSWMGLLRTTWMPLRMFGVEVGYFVLDRRAEGEGELAPALSEGNHRLSTRIALKFGPHVRISFGAGWDLDSPDKPYDQGGMTLTARW